MARPRRPFLRVTATPRDSTWIAGRDARDLIERVGGRPMWSPARRAWHCSASTGADVLALAQSSGYAIVFDREVNDA